MPVMSTAVRPASMGQKSGELVLKNLAEQLLSSDEQWILKQTLQHFRVTRSVPALCTALRPLITCTERLMLLVELAAHLPTDPLRKDFQKLCTLHFPKYHTFLRYFTPQPVTDGSKVIAQDASGQLLVANKHFHHKANGPQTNGVTSEPRHDATSVHGAESGFYSEHDDVSRHGNGRGSVSSWRGATPSDSAPSTLHRPPRPSPRPLPQSQTQSQRTANKRQSQGGILGSGPLKILSGSFQSLALLGKKHHQHSMDSDPHDPDPLHPSSPTPRQKRILLARRHDGSLGVGIKGGKEYGTPIVVYVIEEDCQAEEQGLKIGDRILDVNGTDFRHLTHAEAVTIMRNAWNVIMTVQPGPQSVSDRDSNARREEEGSRTSRELEILVFPSYAGKLGCAVNRDTETGEICVKSVENNSAACKAGLQTDDVIVQIDGMAVSVLTEKQIATLTNSKRVRLTLRRHLPADRTSDSSASQSKSRKDTTMSDEVFSPLDFSSPLAVTDDDAFLFAASTPRDVTRSRSEDRVLATSHQPYSIPIHHTENAWRVETGPGPNDSVGRMYRPRTVAVPPSHHKATYNSVTRGRPPTRQPPPQQNPRYTIVYSVRGKSADTIVHHDVNTRRHRGDTSHSRASRMRYLRHRSRSREGRAVSAADRDLLQAVQAGVEKRQRAVRLSLYQVDRDHDDWKI